MVLTQCALLTQRRPLLHVPPDCAARDEHVGFRPARVRNLAQPPQNAHPLLRAYVGSCICRLVVAQPVVVLFVQRGGHCKEGRSRSPQVHTPPRPCILFSIFANFCFAIQPDELVQRNLELDGTVDLMNSDPRHCHAGAARRLRKNVQPRQTLPGKCHLNHIVADAAAQGRVGPSVPAVHVTQSPICDKVATRTPRSRIQILACAVFQTRD